MKRVAPLAVVPLAVAVASCSSASTPKPKPEATHAVATLAPTTQPSVAKDPTVGSGCVYIQSWYDSNYPTWHSISSDIGDLGKDTADFDTGAAALDGQQLGDDLGKLTNIDNAQVPHGENAASVAALDFIKAKLGLDITAQFAVSGNLAQTAKDIGHVADILSQANHDMDKCAQA